MILLLEKLRQIDPEVQLVEHPTTPYALRCTPSQDRYVGALIKELEYSRNLGVLCLYNYNSKEFYCQTVFDIQPLESEIPKPKKLRWRQKINAILRIVRG